MQRRVLYHVSSRTLYDDGQRRGGRGGGGGGGGDRNRYQGRGRGGSGSGGRGGGGRHSGHGRGGGGGGRSRQHRQARSSSGPSGRMHGSYALDGYGGTKVSWGALGPAAPKAERLLFKEVSGPRTTEEQLARYAGSKVNVELFGAGGGVRSGRGRPRTGDSDRGSAVGVVLPTAMESWAEYADQLGPVVQHNLSMMHFLHPSPVQAAAVPALVQGWDLVATAETGSGKTLAFLGPAIGRALSQPPAGFGDRPDDVLDALLAAAAAASPAAASTSDRSGADEMNTVAVSRRGKGAQSPHILVLVPTRELAVQVWREAQKLCYRSAMRPVVLYGGQSVHAQTTELRRGCHLCIATPGRLEDFLDRGEISLSNVETFVLDEADTMLDMGFIPQVNRIVYDHVGDNKEGQISKQISQNVVVLNSFRDKYDELLRLMSNTTAERTLIFCNTQAQCDHLVSELRTDAGLRINCIHGGKSQSDRERVLDMFRQGSISVLVGTDVASRGLDIQGIDHVINFECPKVKERYIHRIGRTGRMGTQGTATSLLTPREREEAMVVFQALKQDPDNQVPQALHDIVGKMNRNETSNSGKGRRGRGGGRSDGGDRGGRRHGGNRNFDQSKKNRFESRMQEFGNKRRGGGTKRGRQNDSHSRKQWA